MATDPWAVQTPYGVASGSGAFSSAVSESLAQLESLWIGAGGPIGAAPQAAAIAEAESGGNPTAYNATQASGDQSFGLWQINTAAHTQWGSQVTANGAGSIFSPQQNAQDAVSLFTGTGGFSGPWAAEFVPGSPASARYQAALAQAPNPNTSAVTNAVPTPAPSPGFNWSAALNPFDPNYWTGGSNSGPTSVVTGQNGTTALGTSTTDPIGLGAAIGTLQTSWANFWTAHPATLILAGIVLVLIAWGLIASGGSSTSVNVSLPKSAAAAA
jgi:hypothetical protein